MSKNWDSERKDNGFPELDRAEDGLGKPPLQYSPPHSAWASFTSLLPVSPPTKLSDLGPVPLSPSGKLSFVILSLANSC